jgi:hypothetical protein
MGPASVNDVLHNVARNSAVSPAVGVVGAIVIIIPEARP